MTVLSLQRLRSSKGVDLPSRYAEDWRQTFIDRASAALKPGVRVLDVGSGRAPTIPPAARPSECTYVGIDISKSELLRAPAGSYDDFIVGDITDWQPSLVNGFDLIVSWQVLEHVRSLEDSLDNIFSYARPGGVLVAQFSGAFSTFGLLNRVLPSWAGPVALKSLLGRDPETVFPAYYDQCWHGKVKEIMTPWAETEIVPYFRGAGYWRFLSPAQRLYLGYESWAMTRGSENLATHYLIHAVR